MTGTPTTCTSPTGVELAAAAPSVPTEIEIRSWPVTVTVPEAGRCFQLGRDASYEAARTGQLPGVVKVGRRLIVVTSQLRAALGIEPLDGCGAGPPGPTPHLTATEIPSPHQGDRRV